MTNGKIDFKAIYESLIPDIQEANKDITHEEFAAGVENGTMGFKVMIGEPSSIVRGFRKVIFNFLVFLYMAGPFIIVPILCYVADNWWLLFGIGFSHLFTRFSAWDGANHPGKWKGKIIYFVVPFIIAYWIFKGFHFFDYVTFFYFCSLWGHLLFQMAESAQNAYATQMLVERPDIFYEAVANSKIMIIHKDIEDKRKIDEMNQDQASTIMDKGDVKFSKGDYEEAIKYYTESIEKYPYLLAFENRGNAKMKLKDYSGAILDYSEALRRMPEFPDKNMFANIYKNRGNAKLMSGLTKEAQLDFNESDKLLNE
ncbi:MAG: hypothetical protein WCQ95_14910 [Bacteroidota bacterium]